MCYRVECKGCGKFSWGGCGKHLTSLYNSIDTGKHCMCRSWPGVVMAAKQTATAQQQSSGASAPTTTATTAGN